MSHMDQPKQYVRQDDHGVLRVGNTRVSLESLVYRFLDGDSPESIQQQFRVLALEDVYGALTCYLANREEVHQYLKRQEEYWEKVKREIDAEPSPVIERLRALKSTLAAERR